MGAETSFGLADDRYARHHLIPGWDQRRLAAATAVIAGVGSLGNEVAKNLALAGVGVLVLCDPDVVHHSNLSRSVLFASSEWEAGPIAGRPKVDVAASSLRRLAPGIKLDTRQADLECGVGLGELADADVVLGCLDSQHARLQLLGRCALVEAPLADGGTYPWGGEVRLRLSTNEPCYGCSLSAHERGASDLPWSCTEPIEDQPLGASIVASAFIAAMMTAAALGIMFGTPPGYRLVRTDALLGETFTLATARDPDCPHHRPIGATGETVLGSDATVASLLADLPADAEPLTWTNFTTAGNCAHCGTACASMPYLTAEDSVCAACGHRTRLPLSRRIRDAASSVILRDLGVAPLEILPISMPKGEFRWLRLTR